MVDGGEELFGYAGIQEIRKTLVVLKSLYLVGFRRKKDVLGRL
jgi:hypothetical protein